MEEEHNRLVSEQDCGEILTLTAIYIFIYSIFLFITPNYGICFHPGNSLGSSGSRERSLDSDSDGEDMEKVSKRHILVSQESETSTEDDQLSPRASLDLSTLVPETIPEQPSNTNDYGGADSEEL